MDGDIYPANPPFGTGSGVGDSYGTCLLTFPNVDWFKANIVGAINQLTLEGNWSEDGDVGISFAIEEAMKTLEGIIFMAFNPIPVGEIRTMPTFVVPDGFLACDGASYAEDDYPELFAVIGGNFGSSPGHFNVPNLLNLTVIGSGDIYAAGDTGGESTVTLDVLEMPNHSHDDTGHTHTYTPPGVTGLAVAPGEVPFTLPNLIPTLTGSASANITSTGGGEAHNNMQPFMALNYVIYAGR